jgi:hypothetical protein
MGPAWGRRHENRSACRAMKRSSTLRFSRIITLLRSLIQFLFFSATSARNSAGPLLQMVV